VSCRAHRSINLRVALSFLPKRQKKLSQEAHDLWKEPWALSFFFHGLGSNLITTVGSERPEEMPESLFVYSCFYPAGEGPFRAGFESAG
jgi:hypothetical protein